METTFAGSLIPLSDGGEQQPCLVVFLRHDRPLLAVFCLWRGAANKEKVQDIARQAPVDHRAVGLSLPRSPHKQTVESPGCGGLV